MNSRHLAHKTPLRRFLNEAALIRQRAMYMDMLTAYAVSEESCAWNRMVAAGTAIKRIDTQLAELGGAQ